MGKEYLDKWHPYWDDLFYRLEEEIRLQNCDGSSIITEITLLTFPNIDVYGTLEYLKEIGGYCDCKILDIFYSIDDRFY